MKVLVLGGEGMAGHVIVDYVCETREHVDLVYTVRGQPRDSRARTLNGIDKTAVYDCLRACQPDVIINAVGMLNDHAAQQLTDAIYVNSLLPHWLADYGDMHGARVIHISTDCVFSGNEGHYSETAVKDGTSAYAKTKSLGEFVRQNHLVIRTSIVGPELKRNGIGLFHWLMRQTGTIQGFRRVFWNGVTTLTLARIIEQELQSDLSGLVHLTGTSAVSKYDLLCVMASVFEKDDVAIQPTDEVFSDKTLVNTRADFAPVVQDYPAMFQDLRQWMRQHQARYQALYRF
ncbi:dTDP-4-dehydrorhamnose reductase family protein [Alicyclobacillus fodiniaquatilis]|jgi:dTDP-4-dehydrorhamnose reductase|uniref:dTDP-4-dehydrorhamnose reductase n=1 Tax=Alicyclobacillus fodiniaquatilis TaxID=1661150 RepID=A0ABW4JIK6_9BACL